MPFVFFPAGRDCALASVSVEEEAGDVAEEYVGAVDDGPGFDEAPEGYLADDVAMVA